MAVTVVMIETVVPHPRLAKIISLTREKYFPN